MTRLHPLRFEPIYRQYLWGGRRLATVLGKSLDSDANYAESWEAVDHGEDQSRVIAGRMRGATLHQLVSDFSREMLGRHAPRAQFPLLFKFLDAHQNLSVQVHPNDLQAAKLEPPDLGKTEAWVVLHAEPGSLIYAGLNHGINRALFENAVQRGDIESCLHRFAPTTGDCVLLPAGAVHALGAGIMVAEIQQASDATFRLFDWNRVDPEGKPRRLHLAQALETINYDLGPISPCKPVVTVDPQVERLAACEKFVLDRWTFEGAKLLGGDERFHLVAVLEGQLQVEGDPCDQPVEQGQTMLLPAACGPRQLQARHRTVLLDMYLL